MEQSELLGYLVRCIEKLNIPYFISGAIASIAYGEPRFTNDIDIVADVRDEHIAQIKECFPEQKPIRQNKKNASLRRHRGKFCLSGRCDYQKNGPRRESSPAVPAKLRACGQDVFDLRSRIS